MTNASDRELLRAWREHGEEPAFAALVQRHLDTVHAVALRGCGGDTHLAQDVTQRVFSDLARKAEALAPRESLAGWLYLATRNAAAMTVRSERRRRLREQEAQAMHPFDSDAPPDWEPLRPVLDDALHQLNEPDREAVLLRFYQRRELRAVGQALGVSEEAARKRVDRTLDKLRALLSGRGINTSAAALATALAGQAAAGAPTGLAATWAGTAVTAAAASSSTAIPLFHLMATTKLKLTALGTLLAATVATPLLIQHHRLTQLRDENRRLAGQNEELADLQIENQRLSNQVAQASAAPQLTDDQFRELLRLRGEVGALRNQNRDLLARAATQAASGSATTPDSSPASDPPDQNLSYPQTVDGIQIENVGLATPQSATSTLLWSILNGQAEAMRGLLAVGPDGTPPPPLRNIEASLKRQREGLQGVSDIRLSEVRPTDSEAETRLVYDLLRPDGGLRPDWPTQLEVRLQNQGGEWKMVHTGWHADPMVETAVPPAPGEPVGVGQVVTPP